MMEYKKTAVDFCSAAVFLSKKETGVPAERKKRKSIKIFVTKC